MTDAEILAMKPGRELDALVAEKVMGWSRRLSNGFEYWDGEGSKPWVDNWKPSTDISAAWEVVEKGRGDGRSENPNGFLMNIESYWDGTYSAVVYSAKYGLLFNSTLGFFQTVPETICKNALVALLAINQRES